VSNHLAAESSPYLLQHQNNPVDWYPWGLEALARAKSENKPIFLSIGYSACHWCHVMEHESFENELIARYLNEHFVSIKVDREERPDLDQIYMNAVQLMTGRGGWPMSVFLTPDLKPFFGGTYWPPTARMGMPGFEQVLIAVNDAWRNRREAAVKQAEELTGYLAEGGQESGARGQELDAGRMRELLGNAVRQLARAFDSRNGGFGQAPKFPHSMDLQLLLRQWKRKPSEETLRMMTLTLDKMAAGGIYDHLAGGFARYSVDERWLVPHFEKMLYDNALLIAAYLDAYQVEKQVSRHWSYLADTARETCDYILRYMTDAAGGFHSTEDADSEGEEGKFYVWTPDEVRQVLGGGDRAEQFCYVYDVTEQGNFEHGKSILNLPKSIEKCHAVRGWDIGPLRRDLADSRAKLLAVRDQRVRPGKDDKILASWNGLMIHSLAQAAKVLDPDFWRADAKRYRQAAIHAAEFVLKSMSRTDGRLLHTWRHGKAKLDAYLDDYAYLINALVTLYEATFDERWIDEAVRLAELLLKHFEDKEGGGFFFTADDHEQLIARNKDFHDASVPSGNGMAATALIRLGKLTGRTEYLESAHRAIRAGLPTIERSAMAAGQLLIALDMWLGPMQELVLIGGSDEPANQKAIATLQQSYLPNAVIAYRPGDEEECIERGKISILDPLFAGRTASGGQPTLYVCENFMCQAPVSGVEEIQAILRDLSTRRDA
jgi:uncharacterized protein YyaL (SSP411 family)